MARTHKCPFDGKIFLRVHELEEYVEENYKDLVPAKYKGDIKHFLFDYRKPNGGRCRVCGRKTAWNKEKSEYYVLCSVPGSDKIIDKVFAYYRLVRSVFLNKGNTCSQVLRKNYVNNIMRVYNTDNLMADPEYHKKLLELSPYASTVAYNGKEYTVIGTWERRFVEQLEKARLEGRWKYSLLMPGPTVYYVPGDKTKFWIPDAYIPELSLYVSVKDDGTNPNYMHHYVKSAMVFEHIFGNPQYKKKSNPINIIEINSKQLKDVVGTIQSLKRYKKEDILDEIVPVYMHKIRPDLYKKCKQKYNRLRDNF